VEIRALSFPTFIDSNLHDKGAIQSIYTHYTWWCTNVSSSYQKRT